MTQKITQAALVGAGTMAEYHVRGFREAGADIAAIVDKNPENVRIFAKKWSLDQVPVFETITEMHRACPEIRATSIITPNKYHLPLVLEAFENGLHVFCEKPPALNASETERMAQAAQKSNRVLMFDLNNRARLDSQFVKGKIRGGKLGRINSAQATWMRRTGIPGYGGWFTTKAIAGGGPLIDLLHMIDLALWFMDYPEPEFVLAQTFHDFMDDPDFHGSWGAVAEHAVKPDVESACHGFVRFRTGQVLTIHNSWAELVKEEDTFVALQAVRAGVKIRSVNGQNSCEFYSQNHGISADHSYRFRHDLDMGRTRAPENFIRTLNGEAEPLTRASEAVILMRIIDAVYRSAEHARPVEITRDGGYKIL